MKYNVQSRCVVGLLVDEAVWATTESSHDRHRLPARDVAAQSLGAVLHPTARTGLMSAKYLLMDGALTMAWASTKSYHHKSGSDQEPAPGENGEQEIADDNETHASNTDLIARLRKRSNGCQPKLAVAEHLLTKIRDGLVVDGQLTHANGSTTCEAALELLGALPAVRHATVGANKASDTAALISEARDLREARHVTQNITGYRGSNVDGPTAAHAGYGFIHTFPSRIAEANDWFNKMAGVAQTKQRGLGRARGILTLNAATYNLIRLPKLPPIGRRSPNHTVRRCSVLKTLRK